MNTSVKRILSRRESAAFEGLLSASAERDLQVFSKAKLVDLFTLHSLELSKQESEIANKISFDFVLATKDYTPCLAIDSDFKDESSDESRTEADLKMKICSGLGLSHVRIDCRELALYQVSDLMHILIDDFAALHTQKQYSALPALEYHGCLLHPDSCSFLNCSEFQELASWLISQQKEQGRDKQTRSQINLHSYIADDGYCICEIILETENQKQEISRGRCRVSPDASEFGLRLSKSLAACIASRIIEDTRNFVFLSEEPCSIDLKWSRPASPDPPAQFDTQQCFIR